MSEVFLYLDNLLKSDDIVVIGCSGGPDSMALLNILMKYRDNIGISIICCHVNHNVREESYDEMKWLESYCASKDIVFEGMTIENYGEDNFENEARNIRYNFFEEIVKKYNANYLMTAHHGDDLIETILMKIVRGSNLSGYSGFKMNVDKGFYQIVRPLVYATKDELISYDNENNIEYVIDKTNFMDIHTRNRYRRVVLPFLKNEDKNVHRKFLKYSNTLIMYDNYINEQISNQNVGVDYNTMTQQQQQKTLCVYNSNEQTKISIAAIAIAVCYAASFCMSVKVFPSSTWTPATTSAKRHRKRDHLRTTQRKSSQMTSFSSVDTPLAKRRNVMESLWTSL